jgi:uncharacterized membrane protein
MLHEETTMRSTDERIAMVRSKARSMRMRRDRRVNMLLASVSGAASIALVALLVVFSNGGFASTSGYYGTLLRYGSVGGYVLVALCSFLLAAAIVIAIFKAGEKPHQLGNSKIKKDGSHV